MTNTLGRALWRSAGYTAQVDIVKAHPAAVGVLLVRGAFGELWAPADQIYPFNPEVRRPASEMPTAAKETIGI